MKIDYEKGGMQKDIYDQSEVINVSCPFCNNDAYKEIYKERGILGIVQCVSCSLIYVNPRLKNPERVYWGDADKYFNEARLIFGGKAKHHRDPNYLADLKTIYKYRPSGNFLDVGTNMGFFLRNARGWGWNLYGVEPSPSLSKMVRDYFGLNVKTAFLQEAGFADLFFDIVTMTDVFEHLPEPGQVLNEVHRILRPDGILFIKVPNALFNLFKFYIAKITQRLKDYDLFDSYEHVVHYSDKTLRRMLEKYGFTIMKISIGRPVQLPAWHKYVGNYYQYPSPWYLDAKKYLGRELFYWIARLEYSIFGRRIGYFAPNIIAIARKKN